MRRTALTLLALGASLGGIGCTFDERAIAAQPPQVVVHAVLDPGVQVQQVLVERTLSGVANVADALRLDDEDPINTGGGIPVSGATVTITGPDGTYSAREVPAPEKAPGYGAGRYVTQFGGTVIRPGASYVLMVRTPEGAVVTGRTTVPTSFALGNTRVDAFNRDRDSVRVTWRDVKGARSYLLRVESPFGAFLQFMDSTNVTLDGELRNYFTSSLQRVFIPGFRQRVSVAAVDSNYFDYYRTRNDPFTGSGIINNLEGGIGLFGAAVNIATRTVDVVQDPREPSFEGLWDVVEAPFASADVMRMYVETPGDPAALSGWYAYTSAGGTLAGMVGTRSNGRVVLDFLASQVTSDTLRVFRGEQRGDSLIGTFTGIPGRVVFRKRPSQSQ